MTKTVSTPWWTYLLVLAVASAVFCLYFKGLMLDPNRTAPTFGGDGLTIHYNLQYHATYGEGVYLKNQYYPYEESVFMTDAHSLVAVVLAALRPVFPDIGRHAVGIANVLIYWSSPIAVLFLFLCLRRLGVRWPLAMVFGLLVGMMSPQIIRQMGQYTLGFTFLLPATFWYLLSYTDQRWYWFKGLGIALMIYLLGLNNPYLFAIAVSFILAAFGIGTLLRLFGKKLFSWRVLGHWLGVSLLTTITLFLTLQYFDTVEDRVEVPFGFFHNTAVWGGLLSSKEVFTYEAVRSLFGGLAEPRRENRLYLGLIPILFGLLLPLLTLIPKWRRTSGLDKAPILLLTLAAGGLGLIFAFGLPFSRFEYWTYEHLGAILQFRAPVRFGWPLYYVLGIGAGYALSQWYENAKAKKLALVGLIVAIGIWGIEGHQYLKNNLEGHYGPNALWAPNLAHFQDLAAEHDINHENYSSIFLLPTEHGWTDKLHHEGAWKSNHDGYKMSVATGLPLLNGKLSRVSLSTALASLQLLSNPLIERPLLEKVPEEKSILLLNSIKDSLTVEEKRMRSLGELIHRNDKVELRRLSPTALANAHRTSVRAAKADTSLTDDLVRVPLESDTRHAYFGKGSRYLERGWTELFLLPADTLRDSTTYELSLWNFIDKSRFGGPKFYLRLLDKDGKRLKEHYRWINRSFDVQRGWLRLSIPFTVPAETERIELVSEYMHPYWLDEIWLRPLEEDAKVNSKGQVLYNNYLLD